MFQVFFAVMIGAFSIGNAAPNLQSLAIARGAAYTVFQIMKQVGVLLIRKDFHQDCIHVTISSLR